MVIASLTSVVELYALGIQFRSGSRMVLNGIEGNGEGRSWELINVEAEIHQNQQTIH